MTSFQLAERPSLRRRLLAFLLGPVLVVLVAEALLTYLAALTYSNRVHDMDLVDSARGLAGLMVKDSPQNSMSADARFLMEYDPDGPNYYQVSSARRGLIAENAELQPPMEFGHDRQSGLFDTQLGNRRLRGATVTMQTPDGDTLFVTIAETLNDRRARAREILLIAVPVQMLMIIAVLSLVWLGVSRGLRLIEPLTARLGAHGNDLKLAPVTDADVPVELLPLTRTIDGLFTRLRGAQELQERFIADAAHQLRTPLAGLRLHVGRALADRRPEVVAEALRHIDVLSQRGARTSGQLLALLRAQSPATLDTMDQSFDLARLVTSAVSARIHDALAAGSDLGYEGIEPPCAIRGDASLLLDLLDNLIDNALRYAGAGSRITVALRHAEHGILLSVEDNGPGIDDRHLQRLGERFFRVPGGSEPGTGLGLAIARHIALVHGAELRFLHGAGRRGLRVELLLQTPGKGG